MIKKVLASLFIALLMVEFVLPHLLNNGDIKIINRTQLSKVKKNCIEMGNIEASRTGLFYSKRSLFNSLKDKGAKLEGNVIYSGRDRRSTSIVEELIYLQVVKIGIVFQCDKNIWDSLEEQLKPMARTRSS